jgi:hypothetical protein
MMGCGFLGPNFAGSVLWARARQLSRLVYTHWVCVRVYVYACQSTSAPSSKGNMCSTTIEVEFVIVVIKDFVIFLHGSAMCSLS